MDADRQRRICVQRKFNGAEHVISNLSITGNNSDVGLFVLLLEKSMISLLKTPL